jgi:hypothetical protein
MSAGVQNWEQSSTSSGIEWRSFDSPQGAFSARAAIGLQEERSPYSPKGIKKASVAEG